MIIPDINVNLSRRRLLITGGAAGLGALTLSAVGCEKKDVDFYITTVTGSMTQLKQFLPNQAVLIDRAIAVARSVNQAYQDGKFDSALGLATNLTTTINDVIMAAGVNLSDTVKMILSIASVALGTVEVLIRNSAPAQLGAVTAGRTPISSERVNAIFEASRLR